MAAIFCPDLLFHPDKIWQTRTKYGSHMMSGGQIMAAVFCPVMAAIFCPDKIRQP